MVHSPFKESSVGFIPDEEVVACWEEDMHVGFIVGSILGQLELRFGLDFVDSIQ